MRAESPKSSIAQGNALGIRYLPTMRPVRATLIFHYFLQLPLQGALIVCTRLPRALPWAMEVIGLSARFVLLLPNPPIECSSYIKINMTTYLLPITKLYKLKIEQFKNRRRSREQFKIQNSKFKIRFAKYSPGSKKVLQTKN